MWSVSYPLPDSDNYKKISGDKVTFWYGKRHFVLASGASIATYYNARSGLIMEIWVDTNGAKGPNIIGRDMFVMFLYNNGVLDDLNSQNDADDNEDDDPGPNNGVFLRAAVNDSQIGQKEQDAIRDITGQSKELESERGGTGRVGAIETTKPHMDYAGGSRKDYNNHSVISFDANEGTKEDNLMAGHANGVDIHPYTMRVLYLIAY